MQPLTKVKTTVFGLRHKRTKRMATIAEENFSCDLCGIDTIFRLEYCFGYGHPLLFQRREDAENFLALTGEVSELESMDKKPASTQDEREELEIFEIHIDAEV